MKQAWRKKTRALINAGLLLLPVRIQKNRRPRGVDAHTNAMPAAQNYAKAQGK
jgi:hypothetical protein